MQRRLTAPAAVAPAPPQSPPGQSNPPRTRACAAVRAQTTPRFQHCQASQQSLMLESSETAGWATSCKKNGRGDIQQAPSQKLIQFHSPDVPRVPNFLAPHIPDDKTLTGSCRWMQDPGRLAQHETIIRYQVLRPLTFAHVAFQALIRSPAP